MASREHDFIEKNEAGLLSMLQEMVRVPTVNPPGEDYREMVDLLATQSRDAGLRVDIHQVPEKEVRALLGTADYPRYNLIARWDVGARRRFILMHITTLCLCPATGALAMHLLRAFPGGAVYGRGSGDMKGSIAALLMAIRALRESGSQPAFNIECSFTADEETGGQLGAGYVVREGLCKADFAVVCEGAAGSYVGCGHNGVLWLEVDVEGKPAHASRPQDGVNAFEAMASMAVGLERYKRGLASSQRRYRDLNGTERNPTLNVGGVFAGGG